MITVTDNKEPLVDILTVCKKIKINLEPTRLKSEKSIFLRQTVADMLATAEKLLPDNLYFCVNDAFRPVSIQQKYYNSYFQKFKKNYPSYSDSKLKKLTSKFVIDPKDIKRAGHLTGGAIDLVLAKNGRNLPMKNLSFNFERRSITASDQKIKHINNNRLLLLSVMTEAGFVNYSNEYWHFSYGDYMWAEATNNKTTIYDIIKS
jgi:D-alanyl-D-alanine dipeptidase